MSFKRTQSAVSTREPPPQAKSGRFTGPEDGDDTDSAMFDAAFDALPIVPFKPASTSQEEVVPTSDDEELAYQLHHALVRDLISMSDDEEPSIVIPTSDDQEFAEAHYPASLLREAEEPPMDATEDGDQADAASAPLLFDSEDDVTEATPELEGDEDTDDYADSDGSSSEDDNVGSVDLSDKEDGAFEQDDETTLSSSDDEPIPTGTKPPVRRATRAQGKVPDNNVGSVGASPLKGKERPKSEQERSARRDAKNAQDRAARHQHALDNPEEAVLRRQASGRARSHDVAMFWRDGYAQFSGFEQQLQDAIAGHDDDLELLQEAVRVHCEVHGLTPIPIMAPIWQQITPLTLSFLAAIARNPTTWDPRPFLEDGTLVVSKPGDSAPVRRCANYIRRIRVPDAQATQSLQAYLCSHPADAANTVLQLLMLGKPLEEIRAEFAEAMREFGLDGAVNIFMQAVEENPATVRLLGTRLARSDTTFPYAGITAAVACGDRAWDDVEARNDVRIVNYLEVNPTVKWSTFHIRPLDTPINDPLDVRTSAIITQKERILCAILGAAAMNSAYGGVQPILLPSLPHRELVERVRSFHSFFDPRPLGEERDHVREQNMRQVIHDEHRVFIALGEKPISQEGLSGVVKCATSVRMLKGRVVKMEVAKDITTEAFSGIAGMYWDATTGRGPREHRHMAAILNPTIPIHGDLAPVLLALYLGPLFDLWALILRHILYWLCVIFLSRRFDIFEPLLIVSQSNQVCATIRSGDLVHGWGLLSDDDVKKILAGHSPDNLDSKLPSRRFRESKGGDFTEAIGSIKIVRTGLDPARLSLHVPHGHYGRLKYDPILSRLRWNVDFMVELIVETIVQTIAGRLKADDVPDWADAQQVRDWLEDVKCRSETKLRESGVTPELQMAKTAARHAELSVNFLRALISSKRAHEEWLNEGGGSARSRREGVLTAPLGEQRVAQLDGILKFARELDSFGLDPDPNHFGSWEYPILSPAFAAWFLGRPAGKDIVYASNANGRSEVSHLSAKANQARFGDWRRRNPRCADTLATLENIIEEAAKVDPYVCNEFTKSARLAHCDHCHSFVVGRHNDVRHACLGNPKRALIGKEFCDVERVLYVHDILGNPDISSFFGNMAEVLRKFRLVAVPVQKILDASWYIPALQKVLPPPDFTAISTVQQCDSTVYVRQDGIDDPVLLLTLAVDTILARHSTCPPEFSPADPGDRIAWRRQQSALLEDWFSSDTRNTYMVCCHGPPGTARLPHFFLSDKVVPRKSDGIPFRIEPGGRNCSVCDSKNCKFRRWRKPTSLLDLPPHFSRHIWLRSRRGIEWVEVGGKAGGRK